MRGVIQERARRLLTPNISEKRRKKKIADMTLKLVEASSSKLDIVTGVELGGSYAKNTWLVGADIDIFVKVEKNVSDEKFTKLVLDIGYTSMKKYKPYVRFAEHPYVEAVVQGTRVNVVGCYDVKIGDWHSAADRSQYHTIFMKKHLTSKKQQDVRLLKAFLKSNMIYGAEIAKEGFSGYVSEVLIWNLGNFSNVIKKMATIKENEIIGDTSLKFKTPIVIIDPVDNNRNLAAAISTENLVKFVLASRKYLKKPTHSSFANKKTMKPKGNLDDCLVVQFSFKSRSPEIIWGQSKRTATSLSRQLIMAGFNPLQNMVIINQGVVYMLFALQSMDINKNMIKNGPTIYGGDHVQKFINKNFKTSISMWINSSGNVLSLHKRDATHAGKFLNDSLKNNLYAMGVSKGIQNDIKQFKVILGRQVKNKLIKKALYEFVSVDEAFFSKY